MSRNNTIQRVHASFVRNLKPAQRWILDSMFSHRYTAVLGMRQFGKTTGIGYGAGCLGMGIEWRHTETGQIHTLNPDHVQIASKTFPSSQDFTRRSKLILQAYNVGVSNVRARKDSMLDADLGSMSRIALANGKHIAAHAGNPEAIQGMSGHVIIDEIAASRYDPEEIFQQALSASGAEGMNRRVVLIGNASLKGDWWHKFWYDQSPEWKAKRQHFNMLVLDVDTVYPDGVYPIEITERREMMEGHGWDRWFRCKFVDGLTRALKDELIWRTQVGNPRVSKDSAIVIGIDPGLNRNPTGYCVARVGQFAMDIIEAGYWYGPTSGDDVTAHTWMKTQVGMVNDLVAKYRPTRVVVDYSTFAAAVGDALASKFGALVDKVATTTTTRQRRWGVLSAMCVDGSISTPQGPAGDEVRDDLRRLELDETSHTSSKVAQMGKIHLPSCPSADGRHVLHCDVADAVLLCCEHVHASREYGGALFDEL